jgi:hypothetical protein
METLTGTIVEVLNGWDRLVAFKVKTDQGVVETEFCNPPTTPHIGQHVTLEKNNSRFELLSW